MDFSLLQNTKEGILKEQWGPNNIRTHFDFMDKNPLRHFFLKCLLLCFTEKESHPGLERHKSESILMCF